MPLVNSFCCYFSTKAGCAVIGATEVGVAVPSLYYICRTTIDLFLIDRLMEDEGKNENANLAMLRTWINVQFIFFVSLGIFLLAHTIAVGVMIRGTFTGAPHLLIPWLAMAIYRLFSGVVICAVVIAKATFWSERVRKSIDQADMDYYAKFVAWLKAQYPCCSTPSMDTVMQLEALFVLLGLLVSVYYIVIVISHYKVLMGLHHHMAVITDLTKPNVKIEKKMVYRPPRNKNTIDPLPIDGPLAARLAKF